MAKKVLLLFAKFLVILAEPGHPWLDHLLAVSLARRVGEQNNLIA
jgi:hypothetical protein